MFEEKAVITAAVERAVALFARHKRGDVVPWAAVEKAAGFPRFSPHWTQFNKRFRRDFRDQTGIEVWPVAGVGLKLCTPQEQLTDVPQKRQARSLRQMGRGIAALKALPNEELTAHEQTVKFRKIDQARQARNAVLYSVRLGHKLAKPSSPGIPRVKPGA